MNFSLIIPTRERNDELNRLIFSIVDTTDVLKEIEFLFICDNDYLPTLENVKKIIGDYGLQGRMLTRDRSDFSNRDYYNWGATNAQGRYIWAIADDLVFLKKQWDSKILDKLDTFIRNSKDKIICAVIRHNTHFVHGDAKKIPSFPLISREAYHHLGFLLHPQLPTWGADHLLAKLYGSVGRLYSIDDEIYLNHISHHTKQIKADEITERAGRLCAEYAKKDEHNMHWLLKHVIPNQIAELRRYILNA